MVQEQKKLWFRRLFWLALSMISIIVIIVGVGKTAKLVDTECYVDFSETSSDCTLVLTYDEDISEASVEVEFFALNGRSLGVREASYGEIDGNKVFYDFYITGMADGFELLNEEATAAGSQILVPLWGTLLFVFVIFFISRMLFQCKAIEYEGKQIVVYAGAVKNYIMIDGQKVDECNTPLGFFTWIPLFFVISLLSQNEMKYDAENLSVQVKLSAFHRFTIKINNRIY